MAKYCMAKQGFSTIIKVGHVNATNSPNMAVICATTGTTASSGMMGFNIVAQSCKGHNATAL